MFARTTAWRVSEQCIQSTCRNTKNKVLNRSDRLSCQWELSPSDKTVWVAGRILLSLFYKGCSRISLAAQVFHKEKKGNPLSSASIWIIPIQIPLASLFLCSFYSDSSFLIFFFANTYSCSFSSQSSFSSVILFLFFLHFHVFVFILFLLFLVFLVFLLFLVFILSVCLSGYISVCLYI